MACIKFLHHADFEGVYPDPVPAYKSIPKYYKDIAPTFIDPSKNGFTSGTVKKCIPFIEAMSQGYIISLWEDTAVRVEGNHINVFSKMGSTDSHFLEQLAGHPLSNSPSAGVVMKFLSPWVIETKKGYSCLFTSPLNHLETRFKILDGVVETDKFYNPIHLPFIWTGGEGEFVIPKGTPVVQVIPFKREKYSMSVGFADEGKVKQTQAKLATKLADAYKSLFWSNSRKGEE